MTDKASELLPCPQTHYLKTWPEYFNEVLSGRKPFEWRVDDRNFKVGDRLVLQEYIPHPENPGREGQYTGREIHKTVSYLFSPWPTNKRTVVMALTRPPSERPVYCPNGLEHGNCLYPNCISSCPGRLKNEQSLCPKPPCTAFPDCGCLSERPVPQVREAMNARQRVVIEWGERCFGVEHMRDKIVRAARFFEEAAELVQAVGLPRDHAMRAFDHVYSRDPGEPAQEVGGVANTLMALCGTVGLSFDACQIAEIDRCLAKDPSHFAKRNETKLRDVDALTAEGPSEAAVAWRVRLENGSCTMWFDGKPPNYHGPYEVAYSAIPHEEPGQDK